MQGVAVKGIVIRDVSYGDKDKIITVLTPEQGKISVMCRGARGVKSKNLNTTQLFCYSEFVLDTYRDMYYVKESDLISNFYGIRRDLEKFALGQYFCEVANEVCVEDSEQQGMVRLLLNSLYALENEKADRKLIKAAFEMRTCLETGLMPDTEGCRKCGKKSPEFVFFDLMNGVMFCEKCFHEREGLVLPEENGASVIMQISFSVLTAIRYVLFCDAARLFSFSLTGESVDAFSKVCEKYLLNQLGKSFSSLDFYNDL